MNQNAKIMEITMDSEHTMVVIDVNHGITKIWCISIRIQHRTTTEQAIMPTIAMVFDQQPVLDKPQHKL